MRQWLYHGVCMAWFRYSFYTVKIQQLPGLVLRSQDRLLWIARRTVPAPNLHSGASVGRRDLKAQLQVLGLTVMMKQIWNGLQVRCWI